MCYVYIIKGPKSTVYVGITCKDIRRKMNDHREGIDSVKIESPFSLVYVAQTVSREEAQLKKEFIKSLFKAKCLTFKETKAVSHARPIA